MQLLVIVLVVLAVVALLAVWRRLAGGTHATEHAIERHEHALGVLGDVARRAEPPPSVRIVPPAGPAKIHIRPTEGGAALVPRPTGEEVPPPRVRLEPPVVPGQPLAFGTPVQGTPAVRPDAPPAGWEVARAGAAGGADELRRLEEPPVALPPTGTPASPAHRSSGGSRPGRSPRSERERLVRRRATAGMVVVFVAAVVVASVQLAGGGSPARTSATTTTTTHVRGRGAGSPTTTTSSTAPTTTTTLATIVPLTTSASDVSYRAPATSYTLAFQASGPCWIGIQQTAGGPWVWEETVQAGQQATYRASGAVVVRLGAPTLVKVAVDGITVQLPQSNVQAYNLSFSPSA